MSDKTDAQKLAIMYGWLVENVGEHTCGGYGPESNYLHEPTCGFEPIMTVEDLAALLTARGKSATEWGAEWSDGGYCPASQVRWAAGARDDEGFVREHARMWGTRPIRRQVGPWVYADTGEAVSGE